MVDIAEGHFEVVAPQGRGRLGERDPSEHQRLREKGILSQEGFIIGRAGKSTRDDERREQGTLLV